MAGLWHGANRPRSGGLSAPPPDFARRQQHQPHHVTAGEPLTHRMHHHQQQQQQQPRIPNGINSNVSLSVSVSMPPPTMPRHHHPAAFAAPAGPPPVARTVSYSPPPHIHQRQPMPPPRIPTFPPPPSNMIQHGRGIPPPPPPSRPLPQFQQPPNMRMIYPRIPFHPSPTTTTRLHRVMVPPLPPRQQQQHKPHPNPVFSRPLHDSKKENVLQPSNKALTDTTAADGANGGREDNAKRPPSTTCTTKFAGSSSCKPKGGPSDKKEDSKDQRRARDQDAAEILLCLRSTPKGDEDAGKKGTSQLNPDQQPPCSAPSLSSKTQLPTRLALPTDEAKLNSMHCFLRSDLLELFVIQSPKNKQCSADGRVGLRCVHCAQARRRSRNGVEGEAPMAVFYPKSISELYRLVTSWQRVHLRKCHTLPKDVRETYQRLKETDKTRGKTQYWITSANALGLVDCTLKAGGIRFRHAPRGIIEHESVDMNTVANLRSTTS